MDGSGTGPGRGDSGLQSDCSIRFRVGGWGCAVWRRIDTRYHSQYNFDYELQILKKLMCLYVSCS